MLLSRFPFLSLSKSSSLGAKSQTALFIDQDVDDLESITSMNDQISDYHIVRDEQSTSLHFALSKESSPVGSELLIRKIEMRTEHKEQLLFAHHCAPIVMARSARYFNEDATDAFILHANESSGLFYTSPFLEIRAPFQGVVGYLICVFLMCIYASLEKRGPFRGVVGYLMGVFMMLFART